MNLVEELRSKQSRDNRDLLDRAANRISFLEEQLNAYAKAVVEVDKWYKEAQESAIAVVETLINSLKASRAETANAFYMRVRELAIKNANFADDIDETVFLDLLEEILKEFTGEKG